MAYPSPLGATEYDTFLALAKPSYGRMLEILYEGVPNAASIHPASEWRPEIDAILRKHYWHWFDFWDEYRFSLTRVKFHT